MLRVTWNSRVFSRWKFPQHPAWKIGGVRSIGAPQIIDAASIGLQRNVHSVSRLQCSEQLIVQFIENLLVGWAADQVFGFVRIMLKIVKLVSVPNAIVV